jgi:hypothetical protein
MNTSKELKICLFNPAQDESLRLNPIGMVCQRHRPHPAVTPESVVTLAK